MAASKKTAIAIASGVLALGAGIGVANLASADTTPTPTPSPTSTPSGTPSPETGRGWSGPGRGSQDGGLARELADKLGLEEAKVAEALQTIKEKNRPSGRPDPITKPDLAERETALASALSSKLGIDEAKIKSALDEIRAAHQSEREAALKARLDAAVQSATLTQAEADAVQKAVDQGVINFGRR